ncbi:MAG: cell division protein FtsZ, partial [Amaricoccus sp.]
APAPAAAARSVEPAVAAQPAAFADHQAEAEEAAFDEFDSQPVPQPAAIARTAPFGQPKIEQGADGQPRRPGEPSPDALRRLQAAVQNVPKTPPMIQTAQPAVREAERHSRLTINSLIHRMTGQVGRDETPARPRATEPGPQMPAPRLDADYEDTERERVDIPAFLRRQAN